MAVADGERAVSIVPMDGDEGVLSQLVLVAVAVILVEEEVGILAGIDAELKLAPVFFGSILYIRTDGYDAACLDIERHDIDGCGTAHGFSSLGVLSCPEIVP